MLTDSQINEQFSANSTKVLEERYLRKDAQGNVIETIPQMFKRVAAHVAKIDESPAETEALFYDAISRLEFIPSSPVFMNAGEEQAQLAACFVTEIRDSMDGIFEALHTMALIQKSGGGNGFSFSRLRPKNAPVGESGKSSGPIGFMRVFDAASKEIVQGHKRRGANMATLRIDHPDIEEFIDCKAKEGELSHFNISVGITDAFMNAVINNEDWLLVFPDVKDARYKGFNGSLEEAIKAGIPIITYKTVKAKELFYKIVMGAWRNGEPGVLFLDTANRDNPTPHLGQYEATNPCGEIFLLPGENCCLASVNLAKHVTQSEQSENRLDLSKLTRTTQTGVHYLDNVVTVNDYVKEVPELQEKAQSIRRLGLGIMGLADLLFVLRLRYGSEEAVNFCKDLMGFIRDVAAGASADLADIRGVYPAWQDGPKLRNAALLAIAPTGTIATIAGAEGYGCEPVFALSYTRDVMKGNEKFTLRYDSPLFVEALKKAGVQDIERILADVAKTGSCQNVKGVPDEIKRVFVTASDVTPEEHVRMQAALQTYVDNSISKTINLPESATVEDVERAYKLAWELGCKGLTVYRAGSREQEVLKVNKTEVKPVQTKRPVGLAGFTYKNQTPLGSAYTTVNHTQDGRPVEVFLNVGKAGSDTSAVAEAMGRIISLVLQLPSDVPEMERLRRVVDQLEYIGGGRPLGFGHNRVLSLPDGIAQALKLYLGQEVEVQQETKATTGDLCPVCGQATMVYIEGCSRCTNCGNSGC